MVNSFESTLNAIEANSTAISLVTQQYLVGLSILAHTNSIRAQMFNLRRCLAPVEEEEEEADSKEEEDEAPSNVAEGESGPSKKRKHKSWTAVLGPWLSIGVVSWELGSIIFGLFIHGLAYLVPLGKYFYIVLHVATPKEGENK